MIMRRLLLALCLTTALFAQDDPVARARALAAAGEHEAALQLLETHLAAHPEDHDARTLYGTVLSWKGEYARARAELQRAAEADPNNADARAALANVEIWSRSDPRRNSRQVMVGVEHETVAGAPWRQIHAAVRYRMFLVRAAHAERRGLDDQQFEAEAYPRFGARGYAHFSAAAATEGTLYPDWRAGAEYYQGFGEGFECSLGYRRLEFDQSVDLFTASVGKYLGPWLIQGRVFHDTNDPSWQTLVRRYFSDDGTYLGIRGGVARDEIRSGADLEALDHSALIAEGQYVSSGRWLVSGHVGDTRLDEGEGFVIAATLGWRY
jgi:YaiO family outer membrane protein